MSASPVPLSPAQSPSASPMRPRSGTRESGGDSPSPTAPPAEEMAALEEQHELTMEEERTLQADRRRLAKALQDSENREADMIARHRREMEQLRAELERSVQDRQQLEALVEEAQGQQLAAEDSLSVQQTELMEAERLKSRLTHEAAAADTLRMEIEALKESLDASARETAAEQRRVAEARKEAEAANNQLAAIKELRAQEDVQFDAMLAAAVDAKRDAEERARRLELEKEALVAQHNQLERSPNAAGGGNVSFASPGPQVPSLQLRKRGVSMASTAYASPDGNALDSERRSTSCQRFTVGNVNDDSPNASMLSPAVDNSRDMAASNGASGGRGWARHRRNDSNCSDPTPRGSGDVIRPPGDASPNEHAPLMRPTHDDREAAELAGQRRRDAAEPGTQPNKKGGKKGSKKSKKDNSACPCIVA